MAIFVGISVLIGTNSLQAHPIILTVNGSPVFGEIEVSSPSAFVSIGLFLEPGPSCTGYDLRISISSSSLWGLYPDEIHFPTYFEPPGQVWYEGLNSVRVVAGCPAMLHVVWGPAQQTT